MPQPTPGPPYPEDLPSAKIDDVHIRDIRSLVPPACLIEESPYGADIANFVQESRNTIRRIMNGADSRLVVVVGPCTIHDPKAAMEFAGRLRGYAEKVKNDLFVVMRVCFERPSAHGRSWKGLVNDPDLDGSFNINRGFRIARELLQDINRIGLPCGCEFEDTISPQFLADLISWGVIPAGATESQAHRELGSGLSMPIGFQNGTSGNYQIAVDAIRSSSSPHVFLSVSKQGTAGIVQTIGNKDCHVILRGGRDGPNHSAQHLTGVSKELSKHLLPCRIMVDCHQSCDADDDQQATVCKEVADIVGKAGKDIFGVMLRSFIQAGRQEIGGPRLMYGQSITDSCLDWDTTTACLQQLASAMQLRRKSQKQTNGGPPQLEPLQSPFQDAFKEMKSTDTDNLRIVKIRPLVPPACIMEEVPCTDDVADFIQQSRQAIHDILSGKDDRLLVLVGPCSIHDPEAAMEYAARLRHYASTMKSELLVVMRVYFEKPRTVSGWKGLVNDPDLDGSFNINKGLRSARKLLLDINRLGLPCASEFLDPISPQFIADLVSYGAIGPHSTESQVHRELASGLSMPVGFKNVASGNPQASVDAVNSANSPHAFLSVSKQGVSGIVLTAGNSACHVVLQGSREGPNYGEEGVKAATDPLVQTGLCSRVVIDCSHFNSQQNHINQPLVASDIADRVSKGCKEVVGLMLESFLVSGRQDLQPGQPLTYGMSITNACVDWSTTTQVLDSLSNAVKQRRGHPTNPAVLAAPPAKKQRRPVPLTSQTSLVL